MLGALDVMINEFVSLEQGTSWHADLVINVCVTDSYT